MEFCVTREVGTLLLHLAQTLDQVTIFFGSLFSIFHSSITNIIYPDLWLQPENKTRFLTYMCYT